MGEPMKQIITPQGDVQEELSPREARQGWPGIPVLYVLIGGLVLAGLAMAIVLFVSKATDQVPNSQTKGVSSVVTMQRAA